MTRKVDCPTVLPGPTDSEHDGCPVLMKGRAIVVPKGHCGEVQWPLRWPDGQTADISACVAANSLSESYSGSEAATGTVSVRFQGCDQGGRVIAETTATVVDAKAGLIKFTLPQGVCCQSGIYRFSAAVIYDDQPIFQDSGLLSVEHGLWGDTSNMGGPPTLREIRLHLRDHVPENDLLADVEFDDVEIIAAIVHPVMFFNEQPPTLPPFNCGNFPFRHHWRNAIVSQLFRTAAHSYLRNKSKMSSPTLTSDHRDKNAEYLQVAQLYEQEWRTFVHNKKYELNASNFVGSTYDL